MPSIRPPSNITSGTRSRSSQSRSPGLIFEAACWVHARRNFFVLADLTRIAQIILTGGASQTMAEEVVGRVFELFRAENSGVPVILIDRRYQMWVDGITWSGHASVGL